MELPLDGGIILIVIRQENGNRAGPENWWISKARRWHLYPVLCSRLEASELNRGCTRNDSVTSKAAECTGNCRAEKILVLKDRELRL